MAYPPLGARSGGHDSCQAARTAAAGDLEVERAAMGQRWRPQKFQRGAVRQSAATSMAGFLVNCSSAAVQLQKKQSQSLRLACPEV